MKNQRSVRFAVFLFLLVLVLLLAQIPVVATAAIDDVIFPKSIMVGSTFSDPNISVQSLINRGGLSKSNQTDLENTNALTQEMGGLLEYPNYALDANVTASEAYKDNTYDLKAENAVDGDQSTWWATKNKSVSATYELLLTLSSNINQLVLYEFGNYNNMKTVTIEYKNGSNWTEVSNAKVPVYSGQSRTVEFNEVTASEFRLTLTTVIPQPGLNFSEIQLRYVPTIAAQATATNSDDNNPASNLVDKDPTTAWLSDGSAKESVIEIDYGMAKIINTITMDEAKQNTGKLKTIQVDYWAGGEWKTLKTADCTTLPYKKNIFFENVTTSKIRLTVKRDTNGAMKINEITALESAVANIPLDTGLIELEPNVAPNEHQKTMVDRGYTMFVHFGLNTFTETEWTYGDVSPATYTPPSIDADQWVKTAKEAGMKTILLVAKHHDGFALWDSAYTDYDVGNPQSGSHIDVLQAVSDACNKYGVNLGFYYSAWDNNWDLNNGKENDTKYNEYARNQLSELMSGKYGLKDEKGRGVISELWIDGNWEKAGPRWEFGKMYDTVKKLQPDSQIGLNWTIGTTDGRRINPPDQKEGDNIYYFPSDFRLGDGMETSDNDPKLYTYRGQTYYLPFEATLVLNSSWFWHTGYGSRPSMSPDTIVTKYNKYKNEGNILVLNSGPNRQGKIEQADIDSLYAAARKLGIASGDALKKNVLDLERKIYGQNLALNATGSSDQQYTQVAGYGVEKMLDGNSGTRWASRGGDTESTVKITLTGEKTFNTLLLKEDAGFIGRTQSVTIQYEKDGQWIDILTKATLKSGILTVVLETPVTATQLHLIAIDEQMRGPTFSEIELYMVEDGALPEIEAVAEKSALWVGENTQLVVQDSVDKIDLMKIAKFESKDSTVATVDATGKITAVAVGETDITIKVQLVGRTFTKQVHVTVLQAVLDTASNVAAGITKIDTPAQDATILVLPTVPEEYTIAIKSSDHTNVIGLDGTITPSDVETIVYLVLEVTKIADNSKASTVVIPVIVPATKEQQPVKAVLSGAGDVKAGDLFEVSYGLSNVKGGIYAQDLIVTFDPTKLEFVSVLSLKDGFQVINQKEKPGEVRIIAVSMGADKAVMTDGNLLKLGWKSKILTESAHTEIRLTHAVVSDHNGVETQLQTASHNVSITSATQVDKSALNNLINSAQSTHDKSVEGSKVGQYPIGSKAVLKAAIDRAQAVASNEKASQEQVNAAEIELDAALSTFMASMITGGTGDLNGDGKVTVGDLAILASIYGKSITDSDWNLYKFADLNNDDTIDIEDLVIVAKLIIGQ